MNQTATPTQSPAHTHAPAQAPTPVRSAQRIVEALEAAGVRWVFGVPGAKVDQVFDALEDSSIEVVVCRHEQNAAFMAAAVGRLTGRPGVALVTSGPGTSNLATGLVTATTEGDPMIALCGAVPRADRLKRTHQSMDAAGLLATVSKFAGEVDDADNVPEAIVNALRQAEVMPRGAASLVLPADVMAEPTSVPLPPLHRVPALGPARAESIAQAAKLLREARFPVVLAGVRSACAEGAEALHTLLEHTDLPVVETFQAAGLVSRELEDHYLGRVGLFRNQPGDVVLDQADVVLAIGYDPVEYDAKLWNHDASRTIINLDEVAADIDAFYAPTLELRGDIPTTIEALAEALDGLEHPAADRTVIDEQRARLDATAQVDARHDDSFGLDPKAVTLTLRELVDDDTTVISDVGSHYIYLARYFRTYRPRHLLFSNGQQTLGVALPWAIATALVRPGKPVLSVSGDGGFLFSAMELDTAVRLGVNFTHIVFNDGTYDMVAFQQMKKYGRTSGVQLGHPDLVAYAEAFGAHGHRATTLEELARAIRLGQTEDGPTIIDVPVDYRDNLAGLAGDLREGVLS